MASLFLPFFPPLLSLCHFSAYNEDVDSASQDSGEDENDSSDLANGVDSHQVEEGIEFKFKKHGKKKKKSTEKRVDLYAVMGLQHVRWMATEKQIKEAYRKKALEMHPDKARKSNPSEAEKQRIEDQFKELQNAYEALCDPVKKQEFDSTDDFDDSLPTSCDPADFYKVFGPAFRRNARWSTLQPVPDIGDEQAGYAQVDMFYDFWFSFKSWRVFPHEDEEDVEQAEFREQRRWIERYNAKLREKGKKAETKRLREFVEAAYSIDPRIVAQKQKEKEEKERKKREKAEAIQREKDAKLREAEEKKRLQQEEEERQKAAAAEGKKQFEEQKRALKQQRTMFRKYCSPNGSLKSLVNVDVVEKLCSRLTKDQLQALNEKLQPLQESEVPSVVEEAYQQLENSQAQEAEQKRLAAQAAQEATKQKEVQKKLAEVREWSEEEVRMLDKALKKFPQGTRNRWEQVQAYVRTRSIEEITNMVKVRQGASTAKFANQDWRPVKSKKTEEGEAKWQATNRIESLTDVQVNIEGQAASFLGMGDVGEEKSVEKQKSEVANGSGGEAKNGEAAKAGGSKGKSKDGGEWSKEQELALVQALRSIPKDAEERWEKVAAQVGGKTKAQCQRKFKELRESMKKG